MPGPIQEATERRESIRETVKTVKRILVRSATPLKRGVNESDVHCVKILSV